MSSFMDTMGEVDVQLDAAGGPFFMGKDMSLVDCVFAPFLERINASIAYYKGVQVRGSQHFPHLDRSATLLLLHERRESTNHVCVSHHHTLL